jgi:DNA-binding ferritin-like protein
MQVATNDLTIDPPAGAKSTASKSEGWKTVEVLEVLLAHSIHLLDLYKNARWQTADPQFGRLRQLFDAHYEEQIHLVDVLIDRMRTLNGADRIFASAFLHRIQFAQLHCGPVSIIRLMEELLDAHESVLRAAQPTRTNEGQVNRSWTRDFAVGQVILTNDQQILSVSEQSMHHGRMLQTHATWDDRD